MITVNDVRDGVIAALKEQFPNVNRYGEEIKQGLPAPAFFVKLLDAAHDREFGRRYRRSHTFDIHYFSDTNATMHGVAEQLYDCMEYITIGAGQSRGQRMRHEIVDGVLHFFVDFDFHVVRPAAPTPTMQNLTQEGNLK